MALVYTTPEAVFAKIETILIAAGFKRVDRQHVEDFNNYEYPSAFLNDVTRNRIEVCQNVSHYNPHYGVIVAFTRDDTGSMQTTLNSLIATTISAFSADRTLGGLVTALRTKKVTTDQGYYAPHCVAIIPFEVEYLERG